MNKRHTVLLLSLLLVFSVMPVVTAEQSDASLTGVELSVTPVATEEAIETLEQLADGEYELYFQVLHEDKNEISTAGRYIEDKAKLIVEDGRTYAVLTLNSSQYWQSLQTQETQPGSFEDDNFAVAEVLSEDEENGLRVVKFGIQDLDEVLNAIAHIIVTGIPGMGEYDMKHNIRFEFSTKPFVQDSEQEAEEVEEVEGPEAEGSALADGQYTIDFQVLHAEEDNPSSMARYIESPALLEVQDGKNIVHFTLTDHEVITAFRVEDGESFIDTTVEAINEEDNTRVVSFEVADFNTIIKSEVDVYVAARDHTGNYVVRLAFDEGSIAAGPAVKTFEDITTSWAREYIESLASQNIIKGKTEDLFAPNDPITRAQFAVMIARAIELPQQDIEGTFADVTESLDWAVYQIEAANRAGIVLGQGDGNFNPAGEITRQEMVTMIIRAIEHVDDTLLEEVTSEIEFADAATIHNYAQDYVDQAIGLNIINGKVINDEPVFLPLDLATRAEAAKVIYYLLEIL